MEVYVPDSLLVVAEGLVGLVGQVQVEPAQSPVVGAYQDVVSLRVHGNAGVDLGPTHQFLPHGLLL